MPKFATKAADNMFCQARYEAAKHGYICPWCENLMRRSMRDIPKKRKERK